jgi:hypothetical protein
MTVMVMKITYIMLAHLGDIMHAQPVRLHMADVAHEARHEPKHVPRTEPMGLTTDVTANVAAASGSSSGSRRICYLHKKRAEAPQVKSSQVQVKEAPQRLKGWFSLSKFTFR